MPAPAPLSGNPPVNMGSYIQGVSSFGLDQTTLGPEFPALQIYDSQRSRELRYRASYYKCTQHDHKIFDWTGSMKGPGKAQPTQPFIGNSLPSMYIPLTYRRPGAPYRIGRAIVSAFNGMLFGDRWPSVISDDTDTQEFAEALVEATKLKGKMTRARCLGGGCGSVGVSWQFHEGDPRVRVHPAEHLWPQEWADEDEGIPAHVVEIYQFQKDVFDQREKKYVRKSFWHRRDWTEHADIVFVSIPVEKENPTWQIDEKKSVMHQDGFCHFIWIKNLPDDAVTTVDGEPDYDCLYEQMDQLDILNSTGVVGTIKNLDPTLKLKMSKEEVGDAMVKKGSDNALITGISGDASYMELSGSSVTAGNTMVDKQRIQILETAQCIMPDPDKVVGAATSSIALKIVYSPMLGKTNLLRDQYGEAIIQLLGQMIDSARERSANTAIDQPMRGPGGIEMEDEGGNAMTESVMATINLPMNKKEVEILDPKGNPTGDYTTEEKPFIPGSGTVKLKWPDYFPPTSDDIQKQAGASTTATGGLPVMSQKTAVEEFAITNGRKPEDEWVRMTEQQAQAVGGEAGMFPEIGGEVGSENELPEGAEPMPGEEPPPAEPPPGV